MKTLVLLAKVLKIYFITYYYPVTASGVAFKLIEKLTSSEEMEFVKVAKGYSNKIKD